MADKDKSQVRAEKAVIGCLLIDPECIEGLNLSPEMFTGLYTRRLFQEFIAAKGERLDHILLRARISEDDIPEDLFIPLLNECVGLPMYSSEVGKYAALVFEAYRTRMLQNMDPSKDNAEIIAKVESLVFNPPPVSIAKIAQEYSLKCFSPEQDPGFKSGYRMYDNMLGGMKRGTISVVGARTSVGKSAWGLEVALNMAKQKLKVRYISTEMSREEIYHRLVAHESGIISARIQNADHYCGDEEFNNFEAGNQSLYALNDFVIDDDIYDLDTVRSSMIGYDVLIVDYVQEIRMKGSRLDRYEQLAEICRELRIAAKRYDCHVMLLSQLNRYVKDTDEPDVDNLSESDALGKSAAQVTLLWNLDDTRTTKGVKIAKNRRGKTGKCSMKFDGAVNKFIPMTKEDFKPAKPGETPFE